MLSPAVPHKKEPDAVEFMVTHSPNNCALAKIGRPVGGQEAESYNTVTATLPEGANTPSTQDANVDVPNEGLGVHPNE